MLRRIISIALATTGLLLVVLAIASATVWRQSETVTAVLPGPPEAPLVVTEPGVLDMVADRVAVRAIAPDGAPVVLAIGRDRDVTGWVGDARHVLVTGMSSWDELEADAVDGAAEVPSPAGSDMWLAEATGEGEAALDWTAESGRWSLLAASDGTGPAPQVELTWNREVATPFLIPGIVLGALLILASVGIALLREPPAGGPLRSTTDDDEIAAPAPPADEEEKA